MLQTWMCTQWVTKCQVEVKRAVEIKQRESLGAVKLLDLVLSFCIVAISLLAKLVHQVAQYLHQTSRTNYFENMCRFILLYYFLLRPALKELPQWLQFVLKGTWMHQILANKPVFWAWIRAQKIYFIDCICHRRMPCLTLQEAGLKCVTST